MKVCRQQKGRSQSAMAAQAVVAEEEMAEVLAEVHSSSTPRERSTIESAPTIQVHVSSLNGHTSTTRLWGGRIVSRTIVTATPE